MPAEIILIKQAEGSPLRYSLVAGVNDSEEDARQLAGRIKGINCHVNLIPVNPHQGTLLCEVYSTGCGEFQNKT
mgnify:CR=1 FL=1